MYACAELLEAAEPQDALERLANLQCTRASPWSALA